MTEEGLRPEKLNSEFSSKAEAADRYLRELPAKITRNGSYKLNYDESLAEFYVYNHLRERPNLGSVDAILSDLITLKKLDIEPSDAYDMNRFRQFLSNRIEMLIARFQGNLAG